MNKIRERELHGQLERIAREERARLKRIYLHDHEVIYEGDPNKDPYVGMCIWQCAFKRGNCRVQWARNACSFRIAIDRFESPIAFRLGRRDKYGLYPKSFRVNREVRRLRVYVPEGISGKLLRDWFGNKGNVEALRALNLVRGELLRVGCGQLSAYVHPRGHVGNRDLLDRLLGLIRRLPLKAPMKPGMLRTPEGVRFEPKRLPSYVRRHAKLIAEWSIGDDADRSEKIDAAPTRALQRFWDAVSPHLDKIDAYVNSADTGETEALFWIPEAAHEVEGTLALRKRGSRK